MFKFLASLTLVFTILYIPIVVYYYSLLQERDHIRKEVLALSVVRIPSPSPTPQKISLLPQIVEENFGNEKENYSVVIKNLKTGEEYKFNENKKYLSASLYKLWIMAIAFQKIKDGTFKEDQLLSGSQKKLDDTLSATSPTPTPEGFKETEVSEAPKSVSMTLEEAINRMIIHSDNYAALLIANKVGVFSVTNFIKNYGFVNSNFKSPPQTTASDIASYYEKLYNGEIVDKDSSKEMIEILKKQAINDRIPAKLPKNIIVAHKTGELYGVKHDAGIVFNDKGDYIIVVMSDTKDIKLAIKNTADFSEDVFNYFEDN